jgi:aminoglycoside phosphotransferase family enzyme/predicted kinase
MKAGQLSALGRSSSTDFATMLNALARPEAFQEAICPGDRTQAWYHKDGEPITVIQTHASAVLLTRERAYKLKKPKDFGFFDFSTPALRRHFCGQEVHVNRRLAPQVYLSVAPVVEYTDGRFRFGPTCAPDDVPMPGCLLDGGHVVDYAVVMVRLPDEAMLESRVRAGTASPALLAEIARYVAAFHATSRTSEHIASFGGLDIIRGNWEENFTQMKPYLGRTLDAATYDQITGYIRRFLEGRTGLFESRVREGRIRDCHGDLRLQHVYILDTVDDPAQRLAILDGIEFNERFRYGDVASEVAFLTMELEAANRCDLSRAFVDAYVAETGDEALRELLPFYTCYRACVRGKVTSFQLDEPEVPAAQRETARKAATSLFALAASHTSGPTRPTLIMVGGLMGTGKSRLSRALQHELGWALFSSDTVRKCLAHLDPRQPRPDAFGEGLYSPERTASTYKALLAQASDALVLGRSVLLDASFIRQASRQEMAQQASAQGANVIFIECVCPREVALDRLARRWQARLEGSRETTEEASRASDGRPDLYDAQCALWEDFDPQAEAHTQHAVITTTQPITVCVEQVLDVLHMPHFVGCIQPT